MIHWVISWEEREEWKIVVLLHYDDLRKKKEIATENTEKIRFLATDNTEKHG